MIEENLCNDGRCKRVRRGEERHKQHLTEKESKHTNNKNSNDSEIDAFFRNRRSVQILFYILITIAGILSYFSITISETVFKVIFTTFTVVFIGLAFAVLNKGDSMKTRDKIDKILKHLGIESQNKNDS